MPAKKNILILCDWYLPAYKAGGPVRSVAALVYHLREKYNFHVVTSDKDAFDARPLAVQADTWVRGSYGENVMYLSGTVSLSRMRKVLAGLDYDYVYINSFFSKTFSIYPLLLRKRGEIKKPVVLAPRGMLRGGALAIKPLRKKIFIALSKLCGLHDGLIWHATSEEEVLDIKKKFGAGVRVVMAPNFTLPPKHQRTGYSKQSGELKICSVTRLVRNKRIHFALEALREINAGDITYNVYGPPEDGAYYEECFALARAMPPNIQVRFHGDVQPEQVERVLQEHHVFLLPTETENFGHAIVEAMLNGCLPVISDRTPWQGLEGAGLGWDLPLDDKGAYADALRECLLKNETDFRLQSAKVQEFAHAKTSDVNTLSAYEQLFK